MIFCVRTPAISPSANSMQIGAPFATSLFENRQMHTLHFLKIDFDLSFIASGNDGIGMLNESPTIQPQKS